MEAGEDVIYKLKKVTPVTNKKDPICSNNVYLSLLKPTTFGRILSDEIQVRLLSKITPLMISRKHATIAVKDDGIITVSDHDSINGVYVDNKRIRCGVPHEVHLGARITFGCGVGSASPEFEYILEAVCNTRSKRHDNRGQPELVGSPSKRSKVCESPVITIIESNSAQIKEQEEKIQKLTSDLQAKEVLQNELMHQLEEKEKGLGEELEKQKNDLEGERGEAEAKLKALLEQQLLEKENLLRLKYDEQMQFLQQEKDSCENNLQAELSKQLSEKDEAYQQVLEQQKTTLEQAMLSKECEKSMLIAELQVKEGLIEKYKSVEENQRQLEDCLCELKREIKEKEQQLQQQQEVTKRIELDAKQTVIQTMEDEFTCIVCQELFIQATTLPCAHTFCELCLCLWMRKKKNCPVCRRKIKDKAVRSLVLDSAVEKMIETMDEDTRNRRNVLVLERAEQKRRDDATEDPEGVKNMIHRPEDDTGSDEPEQRNVRNNNHETRNRREGYRRRSRSPRYNNRHRPYYDNRNNYQTNNYNNIDVNYHQQQQNITPLIHQMNNSRYYQERADLISTNFHTSHYGYHNNSTRCFICGANDHIARYCQRR